MEGFVRDEIFPLETLAEEWRSPEGREAFRRITDPMKEEVKRQGLWAAHLPPDMGGLGFGQVKLGLMHEILSAAPRTRRSAGCSRCWTASCAPASR
jgi:acyl-CoA dehydrogenase